MSHLFDWNSPATFTENFQIRVVAPIKNLHVEIILKDAVVAPEDKTEVTILVKNPVTSQPVSAEVAIFIVDKVSE